MALACCYESVKYLVQNDIVGRVQTLAPLFEQCLKALATEHPCIKQCRAIGLLGCLLVQTVDCQNPTLQHEAGQEAFERYKEVYAVNGVVGLHRYPHIHCAPPLIITEEEHLEGLDCLERSLSVLDEALGFYDHHHHHVEEENSKHLTFYYNITAALDPWTFFKKSSKIIFFS